MARPKKGEGSAWRMITYDVLGNRSNGYDVNDSYDNGIIDCPFDYPSKSWLANQVNLRSHHIDVDDSNENVIYVNRASDSKPLFEMRREDDE